MTALHFSPNLNKMSKCSNPDNCDFGDAKHVSKQEIAGYSAEEYLGMIYEQRDQNGIDPYEDIIDPEGTGLSEKESERLLAVQGLETFSTVKNEGDAEEEKKGWLEVSESPEAISHQNLLDSHRREHKSLSDRAFMEHQDYVESKVKELYDNELTTDKMFGRKTPEGYAYKAVRAQQHEEIISNYLEKYNNTPSDGKAVVSGGTGGAGKGHTLKNREGIDKDRTDQGVLINPDEIKEIMAERSMIPEVKGLTPMEASPIVHEESAHISEMIMQRALAQKKNIVLDMTCKNLDSTLEKLKQLDDKGYKEINAVFVDVDMQTTAENAQNRHREKFDQWMTEESEEDREYGGRFLPAFVNRESMPSNGSGHNSRNAEVMTSLYKAGYIDSLNIYDNNKETSYDAAGVPVRRYREAKPVNHEEFFNRSNGINAESQKALKVSPSLRRLKKMSAQRKNAIPAPSSQLSESERSDKSLPDL